MLDRKEIVKALDEFWQGFADTLRLRHEYDPNDDAVMVVIHKRDIELLRNVSILLEEQEKWLEMLKENYKALSDANFHADHRRSSKGQIRMEGL